MDLRLENISKHFDSFIANDRISFRVETGKIMAILGENGAGKTTLMNILSGLYQPDTGTIYLDDRPVKITSPHQAIQLGIGMVHQHFMLVPNLTVTENIILGTENSWRLNWSQKQQEILTLAQSYGLEIEPNARIENLPVGQQQRVEILKVLYRQEKLLIFDEPTAVLTPKEVAGFIHILRQLAAAGKTIIFISHKLEEVIKLCDNVTVLRRGKVVATRSTQEVTSQQLSELMVGQGVSLTVNQKVNQSKSTTEKVILSVEKLQVLDDINTPSVRNISFELRAGEILGIAGVDGNGQRELADAIAGLRSIHQGKISFPGSLVHPKIGYIPEDRQKMGLILPFTIAENLILNSFTKSPFCRYFLLQPKAIERNAQISIEKFKIRVSGENVKVSQLSGGNQQKVVLARELAEEPNLIIAMQPTRGLDVGATATVHEELLAQRERGAAILYISTELEEVMTMSDRIAVIYRGEFVDILDANTATLDKIGLLMGGANMT